MRNIRVRIWDKKHKRWFHGATDEESIRIQTDAISLFGETIVMGELLHDTHEDGVWKDDPDIECSLDIMDWLEVCEGTGLRDKNRREIFEGDILADEDDTLMQVIWSDYDCGFIGKWLDREAGYYDDHDLGRSTIHYQYRVIGNIFENPELLDKPSAAETDEHGVPILKPCTKCWCMTKTINRRCGKCGAEREAK